jgi:hypothetical protein
MADKKFPLKFCEICQIETPHYTLRGVPVRCKKCATNGYYKKYRMKTITCHDIWVRTKHRARKEGIEFSITEQDFTIPDRCPALGIVLSKTPGTHATRANSPSLDRIVPEYGYVPGNVVVISFFANQIKCYATPKQVRAVADWMDSVLPFGPGYSIDWDKAIPPEVIEREERKRAEAMAALNGDDDVVEKALRLTAELTGIAHA